MINCKIISKQEETIYADLESVVLPAYSGEMQMLPGHAESFVLLRQGTVSLEAAGGKTDKVEVPEGVCYFKDDNAVLIL